MSIRGRSTRIALAVVAVFALHLTGEMAGATGSTTSSTANGPVNTPANNSAGSGPARTSLSAATAVSGTLTETFSYAGTRDPNQRLAATWDPTRIGAPWVALVHGGSWVGGGPSGVAPAAALFRRHGFQVFNLRYRLVGSVAANPVRWADQRRDVLTALSWIRAHAAAFGLDPNRGALYGSSAGGNLALAAGLAGDGTNGIRVVVSNAGVVQPTRLWDDVLRRTRGERATASMRRLAGHARAAAGCPYPPRAVAGCAARWRAMDVAHALSPHDPAVLLYQGTSDRTVPHQMASAFRRLVDRANVAGSLVLVPRLGHTQQVVLDGGVRQAAMIALVRARTAVRTAPVLTRLTVTRPSHRLTASSRPTLTVRVRPQRAGVAVTGRVVATVGRTTVRARLGHGVASLRLPRLAAGAHAVTLRYEGSPRLQPRVGRVVLAVRN